MVVGRGSADRADCGGRHRDLDCCSIGDHRAAPHPARSRRRATRSGRGLVFRLQKILFERGLRIAPLLSLRYFLTIMRTVFETNESSVPPQVAERYWNAT